MAKNPKVPGELTEDEQHNPHHPGSREPLARGTAPSQPDTGFPSATADQPFSGEPRASTGHSDDAALDSGARGEAHRATNRAPLVPQSNVFGDPTLSADAAVNQKREMSYDEAYALLKDGKLTRSVLTERGWVVPPNPRPPGLVV